MKKIFDETRPPALEQKSMGELKIIEYADRIRRGEPKEKIFNGLSETFKNGIEDRLAHLAEHEAAGIPPQYLGLDSETLDLIWTIPEYIDPERTKKLRAEKAAAINALKEIEVRNALLQTRIQNIGITFSPETAVARKRLRGWSASYELARVAQAQGVDLSQLSREEYVEFAIQNSLAIDDSQLRMPPWQRMCTSVGEIIAGNKMRRSLISEDADQAFNAFAVQVQKRAAEDDRMIQDGVRIRQGTKDSNSWLYFKINGGMGDESPLTYKSYISVKDLNKLTPDRFTSFMGALRDAGYNGDIKIFQDLVTQGINLNDQIVMYGASEADAQLGLSVAEKFFGAELDQKSLGRDEVVDGKNRSYSEILAMKIKASI